MGCCNTHGVLAAVNNHVCGHKCGDSPIIITRDCVTWDYDIVVPGVTSENYWRITSRVTTNIVINGSPYVILFLTWFSDAETQINWWNLPLIDRRYIAVVLWHHANTHCDVILTDCHENVSKWVTCIFLPSSSWLSLVNCQELFTAFSLAGM